MSRAFSLQVAHISVLGRSSIHRIYCGSEREAETLISQTVERRPPSRRDPLVPPRGKAPDATEDPSSAGVQDLGSEWVQPI